MAIEEKASIDTLLIAAEVLERDVIKSDKNSRSSGRDHYAGNGLGEQVFRSIPYHAETFKNMANMNWRNPGSGTFLSNSRSQLTTAPFMAAATEKRRHSAITPPYFAVDDPYHQSVAAAAAADLSSLAAVGATLPQDWLRSLSPHRSFAGSKWAQPSVSNNTRAGVPLPSTSASLSDSSSRSPAFNRLSPTLNKSSFPLNSMGLHDLHDRGFGRGGGRQGLSTLNGLTSSSCRLEADNTQSASTATSSPSSAATSAANVPHKRLRTALLADRPGALLENRTNGRAYSDVTAPWMSSAASASMTRSLVISRDIITSASAESHGSQTSAAIVNNEGPLPRVTVSPSTSTSSRQTDSSAVETPSTAGGGGSPTHVKPPSTAPRLPAKKRKIDWSFSDDPPVMPPLKDRDGAKLSLPCGLDGAQRLTGTPQGSGLLQSAAAAGAVAPLIVDRPAVGPGSEASERPFPALSQSHLLLIEQARRKQSEPFLLPSSSSVSGLCLDAALHTSRSPPTHTPALGELSGTRAPPSTTTTATEVPPPISTHLPAPQPPRRKLSYPNLLDHLSFNYDASLFLSQLQRQRNLEAELQGRIRDESHREEYGLRTPLVVDVSSDEPHRVKSSQECGPISRHHHQRRQKPKPPPLSDISYPRVDHLKAAVAEPTRRFSLAGNVVAPADGVKSRQHRHSSISPPQLHQFQQPSPSPLYIHHDYPQSLTRPANTSKAAVGNLSSNTGRSLLISRSLDKPTTMAVPSPLPSQSLTPVKTRPFSAPENTDSSCPASHTVPHTSFGYQPRNLTTALTDSTPAKPGGTETSYDATVAAAAAIAALSQSSRDPPREHFSGFQELAAASKVPISPNEQLRAGHGPVQGATFSPGRDSKSVEFVHHLALGGLTDEQMNYRKRSLDSLFASESRIGAVRNVVNVPISTGAVSSISEYLAAAAGASQGTVVPQTDVTTVASGFPLLLFSAPSSASAAALAAETALEWGASPTSLIPVPVEIKSLPSGFLSGKRASRRHGDDEEGDDEEDGQREAFTFISTNLPSEDSAGSGSGGSGGGSGGAGDAGGRSSGRQPAPQLIFPVLSSSLKSGSLKKACALGLPMLVPPNAQNLLVNKPKSV